MKLIVGLGNPGNEYKSTRHNVGFIILNKYVNESDWQKNKDYEIATTVINNEKVLFLKPLTFMNLSGFAVAKVLNFYKIDPHDLLVIHDDLDLDVGKIKIKFNSSSGGHNGVQNIIDCISSKEFVQMKVGIGKAKSIDVKDYVLGKLSKDEITALEGMTDVIDYYLKNGLEKTMGNFNKK